jgi:serine/threonine-protein kinase
MAKKEGSEMDESLGHLEPAGESAAEALFEEYLAQLESNPAVDFEAFCAQHPDHAGPLRELLRNDRALLQRIEGAMPTRPPQALEQSISAEGESEPASRRVVEGARIGEFLLLTKLGQGGMGEVWQAESPNRPAQVAVKIIRPERLSQRARDFFDREGRAGLRVKHPSVVGVLDIGEFEGTRYIVQELVPDARTLLDVLESTRRKNKLPPNYYRHSAEVFLQLADALEAVHSQNVVHRDLTPRNVLFTREDVPKVTDFGLARLVDESSLSRTGDFAGTLPYMSPEQVAGRPAVDRRTDIFSLGTLFYEVLTLARPFDGATLQEITNKILFEEPAAPRRRDPEIPAPLAVICKKALEKNRNQRYQSMAELRLDLHRYLSGERVRARVPGPVRKASRWAIRHPVPSLTIAGILAVFVMGQVAWHLYGTVQKEAQARESFEQDGRDRELRASLRLLQGEQLIPTDYPGSRTKASFVPVCEAYLAAFERYGLSLGEPPATASLKGTLTTMNADLRRWLLEGLYELARHTEALLRAPPSYGAPISATQPPGADLPADPNRAVDAWDTVALRIEGVLDAEETNSWRRRVWQARRAFLEQSEGELDSLLTEAELKERSGSDLEFLAKCLEDVRGREEACAILDLALERDWGLYYSHLARGLIADHRARNTSDQGKRLRRWDTAVLHLQVARALQPNSANTLFVIGWVHANRWLRDRKNLDLQERSERILRRAIELDPHLDIAYSWLSQVVGGSNEEKLAIVRQGQKLAPDSAILHFKCAFWLMELQRFEEAAKESELAIAKWAGDLPQSRLLYNLGRAYDQLQKTEQALDAYLRAVESDPTNHKASVNASFMLLETEQYALAVKIGERAHQELPDHINIHINYALALYGLEHHEESIAEFLELCDKHPDASKPRHWLAEIYQDLGEEELAESYREEHRKLKGQVQGPQG